MISYVRQVDTAAKFVQDIIDKAKTEAAKKLNSEQIVSTRCEENVLYKGPDRNVFRLLTRTSRDVGTL